MTANEAPEKIYMTPSFGDPDNVLLASFSKSHLEYHRDIEYIRTDAFIEKAFEFFGEHLWEYINVKNANCDTFINIDGDKLKKDFKNYMKGE